MLGEVIDPRLRYRQGRARRQGEGHPWPRLRIGKVLVHPKEVPLCLTGTVSKICWRFCTGTLRRRLTRSHSIVGALSMAICQWDSKSTVWATGVSSLLGVGHATALHSGRPRDILCAKPPLPARQTFGALRCRGGPRPKF